MNDIDKSLRAGHVAAADDDTAGVGASSKRSTASLDERSATTGAITGQWAARRRRA